MPLYEYVCDACGTRFEQIQKYGDPPPEQCVSCGGGPVSKQQSSPAFQFKGTGWYVTDYAKKSGPAPDASAPSAPEKKADAGAGSKSAPPPAPAATAKPSES